MVIGNGWGGGEGGADFVGPEFFAGGEIDAVKAAISGADDDAIATHNGRAFDFASGLESPDSLACGAVDAVEAFVAAAEDHPIGGESGGGEVGEIAVAILPEDGGGFGVEREDEVSVVADITEAIGGGDGGGDVGIGLDLAKFFAVSELEDMDSAVAAPEDDFAVGGDGGGSVDEIIGGMFPDEFAGGGVDAVEVGVVTTDENPLVIGLGIFGVIGAAENFVLGLILPEEGPGFGVESVEEGIGGADVHGLAEDERGGFDGGGGFEGPEFFA